MSDAQSDLPLWDGRYKLKRTLGKGGMGRVSYAIDHQTGREVALKICLRNYGTNERWFEREFSVQQLLGSMHRCVPRVYEYALCEREHRLPAPYFTMEYIPGRPLFVEIKKQYRSEDRLRLMWRVSASLFWTLSYMHAFGIVHHDVKPGNILVTRDASKQLQVFLIDFGIASSPRFDSDEYEFIGTPEYAAPEMLEEYEAGVKTDLYSVGLIMYEILMKARPWDGSDEEQLADDRRHKPYRDLPRWCPARVVSLIVSLLSADPKNRPDSAKIAYQRLVEAMGETVASWSATTGDREDVVSMHGHGVL